MKFIKGILIFLILLLVTGCGCNLIGGNKKNIGLNNEQVPKTSNLEDNVPKDSAVGEKISIESTEEEKIPKVDNTKEQDDDLVKGNEPLKYNDRDVVILMYHSVDYEKNNRLRVPREQFKEQMKYIKDSGYTTLTLKELYNFISENKPVPQKSVVITFDDGYADNYNNAYPILKEYNLKATIFVIVNKIDRDNRYLNSNELRLMRENGIDIQSHTLNHEDLSRLTYDKQLKTLKESKVKLENIMNKEVDYLAYPFGKYNDDTIKAVKDSGYKMAFITGGKEEGIYRIKRAGIYANENIEVFKGRLKR